MAFTDWRLDTGTMVSAIVALSAASFYLGILRFSRLRPIHLAFGVVAYGCAIAAIIHFGFTKG
ncbi:MAG: hypothetical protein IPO31_07640 [Candidatus Obscuribacter sp.]|nr:hypothetical protein [Candidatus Obscuribacter sp.]